MKKKDYMQSVFSGISRHGMRMGQLRVLWSIGSLDGVASLSDMLLATGISESHAQAALRALIRTGEVEIVGKNRFGETGYIDLKWDAAATTYREV